jgi:hypothetical protein
MNNFSKYSYIALFGMSLFFIGSCSKNNLVIDKEISAPAFAKFSTIKDADSIGTYYIKSTNDPFKLPIGVTNVTNTDRTIKFSYTSSTAVMGAQYNAPSSVVIKAGQALDSLTISGLFSGYPLSTRKDTVTIAIEGGDVPANAYKGKYKLILRKYCDVIMPDFYGKYVKCWDGGYGTGYGPYTMSVVAGSAVSTGATTGTIQVTNLWDYGSSPQPTIKVALDWTDPANFKVTIPDQAFVAADDVWIKNSATIGSFSSCDQTFVFKYTLYYKTTGANYYANQSTDMRR